MRLMATESGTLAPKKIFEMSAPLIKRFLSGKFPRTGSTSRSRTQTDLIETIEKLFDKVEKRTGLNLANATDREAFILAATVAFYRPNAPGPELKHTAQSLIRLLDDISRVRAQMNLRSDLEACTELLKREPYKTWTVGEQKKAYKPSSLRRLLGPARKLKTAANSRR
jgi:hypothetical protein